MMKNLFQGYIHIFKALMPHPFMSIHIINIILSRQITSMQEPQSMVIKQEQKESNPIFKVVFNKIRNLRKKIAQIQHIRTMDQRTLKPAQLEKLTKEEQIEAEIEKYEQFAKVYKAILIENNLAYDKVDDLIKISSLITVGKRVKTRNYCPSQVKNVYENFYDKIYGDTFQGQKDLAQQVIRVYHLLWGYLEKLSHYSQCRDYMSYIEEIEQRMNKQKPKNQKTHKNIKKQPLVEPLKPILEDINKKIQKLSLKSQIFKISLEKIFETDPLSCYLQIPNLEKVISSEKELDLKKDNSTTIPERDKQSKQLQRQMIEASLNSDNSIWVKKDSTQSQEKNANFHGANNKVVSNSVKNNRTAKNRQRRNRRNNNKKAQNVEFQFNVRKCSDTSLQPTPEKTWNKKKYMEKKERY